MTLRDSALHAPRLLLASLSLLAALAAVAVTVHFGLWRALDRQAVTASVYGAPCAVVRAGYTVSPWLSAELSLLYAGALAALLFRQRRWAAAWLLVGLLATAPVEWVAKHLVDQPPPRRALALQRPDCGEEGYQLTVIPAPHAFPSGSVTRLVYFSALAVSAAGRWGRWRTPARAGMVVVALAAAATRVPIGWHWPSDVVGGTLLGAAMAGLVLWRLDVPLATAGGLRRRWCTFTTPDVVKPDPRSTGRQVSPRRR